MLNIQYFFFYFTFVSQKLLAILEKSTNEIWKNSYDYCSINKPMNTAFYVLNVSNIYSDEMHGRIGIYSQK